jgi:uncharacterized protein YggE
MNMRNSRLAAALGAAMLVGSALLSACAPNGSASALSEVNNSNQDTIVVTGTGQAKGTPDLAIVTLGVEARDSDLQTALDQVNSKMSAVSSALSDMGIAQQDMQTSTFDVRQEQPRNPQTGELTGEITFVVTNLLTAQIHQIDQAGEVVGAALDAGANEVTNLSFTFQDSQELESEARKMAAQNAQDKANELAAALGVSVGPPIQIQETGATPRPETVQAQAALGGGGPTISPGQLSVTVQVSVTFRLQP